MFAVVTVVISNNIKDENIEDKNRIVSSDNGEYNEKKRETKEEERSSISAIMTSNGESEITGPNSSVRRTTNCVDEEKKNMSECHDRKNER